MEFIGIHRVWPTDNWARKLDTFESVKKAIDEMKALLGWFGGEEDGIKWMENGVGLKISDPKLG